MAKGITFKIEDAFHTELRITLVKKGMKLTKLVEELLHKWVKDNKEEEEK